MGKIQENIFFKADKISGFEGNLFFSSIILEVIKRANERNRYKFPFYALSLDLKRDKGDEWFREKEYKKVCDRIVSDFGKGGEKYFDAVKKTAVKETLIFHKYALRLIQEIPEYTSSQLIAEYKKFCKTYAYYYALGAITFLFEHILSERLAMSLLGKYDNATGIIAELLKSNYRSFMAKSNDLLYKIKKEKNKKIRFNMIAKYQNSFFFMKTNYRIAPVLTPQIILDMAKKMEEGGLPNKRKANKKIYFKNIKLTREEKNIVALLKRAEVIRDQRKQLNITGSYILGRFLDEAKKRSKISNKLASRIFWYEYKLLVNNPKKLIPKLRKRKEATVVLEKDKTYYFEKIAIKENIGFKKVNEIKGTPASQGKFTGIARIILVAAIQKLSIWRDIGSRNDSAGFPFHREKSGSDHHR